MIFLNPFKQPTMALAFATLVAVAWLPTSYADNVPIGKCFTHKAAPGEDYCSGSSAAVSGNSKGNTVISVPNCWAFKSDAYKITFLCYDTACNSCIGLAAAKGTCAHTDSDNPILE